MKRLLGLTLVTLVSLTASVFAQTPCPPACTHADYESGEAGYQLGRTIFNNTIGKDNPIPDPKSAEDRVRDQFREWGREEASSGNASR